MVNRDPEEPLLSEEEGRQNNVPAKSGFYTIFKNFVLMGWVAFGGPAAHIGLFEKTFVEQMKWMSASVFAELLALCQCLPGPTSTQVSFAIGVVQQGTLGGLFSGVLFQYPGAFMMSAAGLGAAKFLLEPSALTTAIVAGLSAAGVALVVDACLGLGKKLVTTTDTQVICLISACVSYYASAHFKLSTAWVFPMLIVFGGLSTRIARKNTPVTSAVEDNHVSSLGLSLKAGGFLLAVHFCILIAVIVLKRMIPYDDCPQLHWFEAFYTTGSLIWGGGQVVLPLLLSKVETWISPQEFYTGLALVQAMPGPLFNISAYLGALLGGPTGILICWVGLFGPGVMLIFGVLPFWGWFRSNRNYKLALPGLNASSVGLIVASCFQMALKVRSISPFPDASLLIGMASFCFVHLYNLPAPLAIAICGGFGVVAHFAHAQ
mmetsp:Transcript_23493/g.39353  ORF Transcript_23493/g.39353 Transcript_23493/m.39353 type:complete len:433 (-) Transcript_23493:498-1796(-)|eukprot:CAMPEP_0198211046 /NCGR_PEP_ID=MMETSP1445-20131203/22593_1 /TAXON_ID=36898 /ORGANISM="Pyramimonas sp., Strain CCMP2087" /LENGTH=432 /DNA_ID=CAMNT_0043885235 /DNA_START=144 /DNA_END=1442 /DNA_ORIENTATION=+